MRLSGGIATIVLASGLMALAQTPSLQEQSMCAKQAKIAFEEDNRADEKNRLQLKTEPVSSDYQSHYNPKLNKCFVLIERTVQMNGEFNNDAQLSDAFERRIFATYGWTSKKGKEYWEVPPTICELTPASKESINCSSKEEFDDFVAKYLEQ
jgi:hypothetical protein